MAIDVSKSSAVVVTQAFEDIDVSVTPTVSGISISGKTRGTVINDSLRKLSDELTLLWELASEQLKIDSPEGVDSLLRERALITLRPELIALINFLPIASFKNSSTAAGLMLDLQYAIRNLLVEDIEMIISLLEEDERFQSGLEDLQREYDQVVEDTKEKLSLMSKIMTQINNMKRALDLLNNSDSLRSAVNTLRANRGSDSPPVGQFSTLENLLSCHLGFDEKKVIKFSNSKIAGQLIVDLKNSLTAFSPRLLGVHDENRLNDESSIDFNKKVSSDEDFSFTISSISSTFDLTDYSEFLSFQESLPADDRDRIKIMLVALSRELRMSAGITRMEGTNLGTSYSIGTSGLLDRILGEPGDKIIDDVPSEGTLSSMLRFKDENGNIILPFESRQVLDLSKDQAYIPGSIFLVDSILRGDDKFKTDSLKQYTSAVYQVTENATQALVKLLNFDDEQKTLYFDTIFHEILSFVVDATSSLILSTTPTEIQSLGAALLTAAQTDLTLKYLLFRYTLAIRSGDYAFSATTDSTDTDSSPIGRSFGDFVSNLSLNMSKLMSNTFSDLGSINVSNIPQYVEARVKSLYGSQRIFKGLVGGVISDRVQTSTSRTASTVTLANGTIADILDSGFANEDFIFWMMAHYLDYLLEVATELSTRDRQARKTSGDEEKGIKTSDGLTKMNRLSDDTLMLLVFEIVTAIFSKFIDVQFTSVSNSGTVKISINQSKVATVRSKMMSLSGRQSDSGSALRRSSFATFGIDRLNAATLESMSESFSTEDAVIRDLIDMIRAIGSTIKETADEVAFFFDSSASSSTGNLLSTFLSSKESEAIIQGLTDMQVIDSWQAYEDLLNTSGISTLPNEVILTESEYNSIKSFFSEPRFTAPSGNNLKIVAVGLPSGLLTALQHPTFTVGEDTSLRSEASDLVTVKIYRIDLEFEDLIFKPQSFLFDMSRFAINTSSVSEGTSFDTILSTAMQLRNISSENGIDLTESLSDIKQNEKYDGLTEEEIEFLFQNHVISELLRWYIKLMTGMNLSEYTFLTDETLLQVEATDAIKSFMETFLSSGVQDDHSSQSIVSQIISGIPLVDLIKQPSIRKTSQITVNTSGSKLRQFLDLGSRIGFNSESEDTVAEDDMDEEQLNRFKRLISTVFFSKEIQRARIVQPKLFERVFLVPVNLNDFEIDVSATISTQAGRRMWASNKFRNCLIEESRDGNTVYKLDTRDATFSELIAVIALGADF